jgi:flagellar biosynthesis/type III secretory pathway protein FliH
LEVPANQEFLLVNWVETYLQLSGPDLAEYQKLRERATPEEIHVMQLTWAERREREYSKKGRREGREEGRQEAVQSLRKLVLRLVEQRFGPVPEATRQKVEGIDSLKRLTSIAEKILVVPSLDKLRLG